MLRTKVAMHITAGRTPHTLGAMRSNGSTSHGLEDEPAKPEAEKRPRKLRNAKEAEKREERQCLSHECSGNTKRRQCLTCRGAGELPKGDPERSGKTVEGQGKAVLMSREANHVWRGHQHDHHYFPWRTPSTN